MNLIIKQKKFNPLDIFIIDYVIPELYRLFYLNLNPYLLKNWDEYFESIYKWEEEDTPKLTLEILLCGIKNLRLMEMGGDYIITIDSNQNMPGTTAKLYDLCSLINYGNLEMPPYPIFEDTFKQIKPIIPLLFEEYTENL